jgi:hypothetical protein
LNATADLFDDNTCAVSRFLHNPTDVLLAERVFNYLYTLSPTESVVSVWLSAVCTTAAKGDYESLRMFVRLSRNLSFQMGSPDLFPAVLAMLDTKLVGVTKELYIGASLELIPTVCKLKHLICIYQKLAFTPDNYTMSSMLHKGHKVHSMKNMEKLMTTIVPAFKEHGGTLEAAEFFVRLTVKHNASGLLNPKVLPYLIRERCSLLLAAVVKEGLGRGWGTNDPSVSRAIVKGVEANNTTCEQYAPITTFRPECTATSCSWETLVKSGKNKEAPYRQWVISLLRNTKTTSFYTHVHFGCHHSARNSNPFPVTAILAYQDMDNTIIKACKELLVAVQPIKFKGISSELADALANTINACNQFHGIRYTITSGLGQNVLSRAKQMEDPPWAAMILFAHMHMIPKWLAGVPLKVKFLEYCIRSRENRAFRLMSVWDALSSSSSSQCHLLRAAAIDLGDIEKLKQIVPETLALAKQLFKRCTSNKGADIFLCLRRTSQHQMWFLPLMRFGFQPGVPTWLISTNTKTRAYTILAALQNTSRNSTLPHLPKELQHIIVALAK